MQHYYDIEGLQHEFNSSKHGEEVTKVTNVFVRDKDRY